MGIDNFNSNNLPPNLPTEKAEVEQNTLFNSVIDRYNKNTELRGSLARVFTIVIIFWLLSIILILVGNTLKYQLSDTVLVTLLTTSTVQVLGMMVIILWDLFPGGQGKNNPNATSEKLKSTRLKPSVKKKPKKK